MNNIQGLIDRQLGFYCHLNYDNVLKRLVVDGEESFYGLQSAGVTPFDQDPPIFACRFAEVAGREHILALANEDGRVAIQDTTSITSTQSIEGFQCHNNAVFDLAWMPGSMNFVTVSGDHTACLWDIGDGAPRRVSVFSSHTRSVKTAVFRPRSPSVFASGARDGHVLVWDARAAPRPALVLRPDNQLLACHSSFAPKPPGSGSHGKRPRREPRVTSITGLAFQDDATLLSCGECDGNIKAWDLRKNHSGLRREPLPKHSIPYCGSSARRGYTNLVVDDARLRLYASCTDNVIYRFNLGEWGAAPERRYVGHENATFYIKAGLSPDGEYLVSGSSDQCAYVWNVRRSRPLLRLAGHRAEVTCAAWCRRGLARLVTCGDDARHKVWRVGPEHLSEGDARAAAGRAERAPSPPPPVARADTTPVSAKRRQPEALSEPTKRARATDAGARRTKRCLTDLMNASAGDAESSVKRLRLDAPLPPLEEQPARAGVKRRISETSPPRRPASPADWSYLEPRPGSSCMTPTKNYEPRLTSPRGAGDTSPKLRIISFGTPTKDLPNFVVSGEAPHLRLMSPAKRRRERPNWLTQLSRELRDRRADGAERAAGDKLVDKAVSAAPAPTGGPARRSSQSDRTPKANKRAGTLLKYFNVTGSSCK